MHTIDFATKKRISFHVKRSPFFCLFPAAGSGHIEGTILLLQCGAAVDIADEVSHGMTSRHKCIL